MLAAALFLKAPPLNFSDFPVGRLC